jgi:hypothetical protein
VRIRGKVVDSNGAPVANVSLYPANRIGNNSPVELPDAATGEFDLGPYPAGEYALLVAAAGFVGIRLPWRQLDKDAVWDVGTLQLDRGGSLLARLQPQMPAPPTALRLAVLDLDGTFVQRVDLQDLTGRAGPMRAGNYLLQLRGIDVACEERSFEVRSGIETVLDVPLRACVAVDFEFAIADGEVDRLRVEVRDSNKTPVLRTEVWRRPEGFLLTAGFAPGDYELGVSSKNGEHGNATITVDASGRARVAVQLKK